MRQAPSPRADRSTLFGEAGRRSLCCVSLLGKLQSASRGEVSIAGVAAYSTANSDAYSLLDELSEPEAARLAAWCAFVLQTYADNMLESGTVPGFASPEACEEAVVMYQLVGTWLGRAHAAAANSGRLDTSVPQPLPQPRAPRTMGVLKAMKTTLETVQTRAGANIETLAGDPNHDRLASMMSTVRSAIDAAGALTAHSVGDDLRATLAQTLQAGLNAAYEVGQLLAMPALLAKPTPASPNRVVHDSTSIGLFLPGDPGFDPWCLVDPKGRGHKAASPQMNALLDAFWASDPDPASTLAIQAEISAAIERGDADYMPDEVGPWTRRADRCPWSAVLYARTPLTIAGKQLAPGDAFFLEVGAREDGFQRDVFTYSRGAAIGSDGGWR